MIHAMGWLIKITLFSIFILVLGNWIQWNGRSVSDQVKTQISHAERSDIANSLRRWTGNVAHDARNGAAHKNVQSVRHKNESRPKEEVPSQEVSYEETTEKIPSSERQKLRALIQELNTSTSADRRGTH